MGTRLETGQGLETPARAMTRVFMNSVQLSAFSHQLV
jgi:hypothetical protein